MMYSRNTGFQEIWESLGGRCWDCQNGVFHQYAPAATSNWSLNSGFFWSANGLDVFVIGTDLGLWRKHGVYSSQTATNVSWSNWISCGGTCISSPAAASPTPGVNDVFVLGGDGAIWHWNSWNGGWESLGGYFIGDITVISRGAGRLDLAAVAPSIYGIYLGKVWHRAYYNGAWNNWFGTDVFINSSDYCRPALASWSSNRIDVFGSGSFDFPN